jgi:Arc/MetJ-type ribon-helix-helix transcriptional regulator
MSSVTLSAETQKLLADHVFFGGYANADDLIRDALDALDANEQAIVDLDADALAAIAEGESQADRGEGRPLSEVREDLRQRFKLDRL